MRKFIQLLVPALIIVSSITVFPAQAAPTEQKVVLVETLSLGDAHSCALNDAGLVRCWGNNIYGQLDVPSNLGVVTQVSAGWLHTCALTSAGLVRCWGTNYNGQLNVPSNLGVVSQVSAGGSHTCALTSAGLVRCWGYRGYGAADVPLNLGVVTQVSAGGSHTCALTSAGLVRCWGHNSYGATDVPSDLGVVTQVRAGEAHTCALTSAGLVRCWGDNGYGPSDVPLNLGVVTQVSAGGRHTCALTSAGLVRCWGDFRDGQTDVPSSVIPNSPCLVVIDTTLPWLGTSSQPSIAGIPAFGQSLKGSNGSWASGTKFCVFWIADGVVVPKATSSTYKLQGSEVGKNVQFVVVGIDKNSKRTVKISEPLLVTKANFTNAKAPVVKSPAKVGVKLTSSLSSWGTGTSYSYQWFRNSEEILGATTSSYIPTAIDVDANLTLRACGSKQNFESRCIDSVAQIVSLGVISKVGQVSIGGTSTNVGATLIGNTTQWMPATELTWQWLRNGEDVAGATGSTFTITRDDRGKTISLRVTGHAEGYQSVSKLSKDKRMP